MQTFLPFPSSDKSAACLDYRRLGKQRVEAWMILEIILGERQSAWATHPAVTMWEEYPDALAAYGVTCCLEWKARGYIDNLLLRFHGLVRSHDLFGPETAILPPWFGDEDFHRTKVT